MVPSKAGSETEDESQRDTGVASPTGSHIAKDKSTMTREEREAKYKETRERIFGPETETAESSEGVNGVSRTSSSNEKKKKKHKNNDDGFEARSQFNAYYPSMQYPVTTYDQSTNSTAYYSPYAMQTGDMMSQNGHLGASMLQQGYHQGYQTVTNAQGFPTARGQNSSLNRYDMQNPQAVSYDPQTSSHYYSPVHEGNNMGQQSPAMSSAAISNQAQYARPQSQMSDQPWPQTGYPYPYAQPRDQLQFFPSQMPGPNTMSGVASIPYQYGQLPIQAGMQGARAQHPLPGSYKSQSFNPQTRAFVPNGGSVPVQSVPLLNSPNYSTRGAAMSFQNSNQHSPSSQQDSSYSQVLLNTSPGPHNFSQESRPYGARKSSSQAHATHSPVQSSLSKWGTPSHLPRKPPPPETPSIPEGQHSLPMNSQFNISVQAMNGGLPNFQNGVYSMPGAGPQAT